MLKIGRIWVLQDVLHYTERTQGKYRDLRSLEVRFPWKAHRRFARVSLNGQYRGSKSHHETTRYANPGWSFGTEQVFLNWTHFRRHCWHLSLHVLRRGATLSYGRSII